MCFPTVIFPDLAATIAISAIDFKAPGHGGWTDALLSNCREPGGVKAHRLTFLSGQISTFIECLYRLLPAANCRRYRRL